MRAVQSAPRRRRRNPGPKGAEKRAALASAYGRAVRSHIVSDEPGQRLARLQKAYIRRRIVDARRGRLGNPGPKGRAKSSAVIRAYERSIRAGAGRNTGRRAQALHEALRRREQLGHVRRKTRRWVARKNPIGLAGFASVNPQPRSKHMARRRRSAAQRAATRKMIAANHAARGPKRRRRRRSRPAIVRRRRKGAPMARARHARRRRSRTAVMTNPRRRRSRHRRFSPRRVRRSRSRRQNPGAPGGGIKGALKGVFMVGVPALGAGAIANFVDAKIADKHIVIRILAKVVQAAAWGMMFRRRPIIAYGAMGAAIGSIGGEFGTRMGGGVIVGGTPVEKAKGVAALITEDPRTMGVLVEGMRGMGYQIDNNVSLGDNSALPAGTYQDVNLG